MGIKRSLVNEPKDVICVRFLLFFSTATKENILEKIMNQRRRN